MNTVPPMPALPFRPILISQPTWAEIKKVCPTYETMLLTILDAILNRYDRTPDYHFIDTKLNLITGEDFVPGPDPEHDFRSRRVIYGWIQGRGLEALVGHAEWLRTTSTFASWDTETRIQKITRVVREVTLQMESIRARNSDRLFFMMTPEGQPLHVADDGRVLPLKQIPPESNFTDLFYAKGLFAAATFLGWQDKTDEAKCLMRRVLADIDAQRFASDQQFFEPNKRPPVMTGRVSHGPRMIAIGGLALFYEKTGEVEWLRKGEEYIRYLLDRHVNVGQYPELQLYDYVEYLTEAGTPWVSEGEVLSDPGHTLEFIGLLLKLLSPLRRQIQPETADPRLLNRCRHLLPKVFVHNFRLGFDAEHGGIRKAIGLLRRRPLNDDMPWWSLPETIRAAAELAIFAPEAPEKKEILAALAVCSNAFLLHYVNPAVHLMAYQTRNRHGVPVDVIPATPDADPGYHTGLSLIDFLQLAATTSEH